MSQNGTVHPWVAEGQTRVRFAVTMVASDWAVTRHLAQAAEALGFDAIWMPDHPLLGYDGWTQLAALAASTRTIRLGTMVTCAYYRNPVLLARIVADVDRISGGRALLGLGSGDMPWEFEQMGLEYPGPTQRAAVLEETLKVIATLLRGETVDFRGEAVSVRGASLRNPAIQSPRVPILIAGGGEKTTLRLVAEYADASNMGAASWAGGAFTPEQAAHKLDVLRSHCEANGRPFESVLLTYQIGFNLADTAEQAAAMRETALADPIRGRTLQFLEKIPNFCTPDEAIEKLTQLTQAGFRYFVGNSTSVPALERLANEVIAPVRAATLA